MFPEASKQLLTKYIKGSIYVLVVLLPYGKNTRKKRYEMSKRSKSNKDLYTHNFTVVNTV